MTGPWCPEHDALVKQSWGHLAASRLAKRLGRTVPAVRKRAYRLGLGAWSQGRQTMAEIARWSGFHVATLREVAKTMGPAYVQRVTPRQKTSPYAIREDLAAELVREVVRRTNERAA